MFVYQLEHSVGDYPPQWETVSIHRTPEGAEKAKKDFREKLALEYEEIQKKNLETHGERLDYNYDDDSDWIINEIELKD